MKKKKKMHLRIQTEYEQVAIIHSDIYIRQQFQYILGSSTEEYAFGAVAERELSCKKKKKI